MPKKQIGAKKQIWGAHLQTPVDDQVIAFCSGRDVRGIPAADSRLIAYDIFTNLAHSAMLCKIGVYTLAEYQAVHKALLTLKARFEAGEFALLPEKEDVHMNVEVFVTETCAVAAGKKMHTARSRNDQVATDMRLYLRDQLLDLGMALLNWVDALHHRLQQEPHLVMPGFTHYQPAMWTSFAHWLTCWSQGLIRSIMRVEQDLAMLNRSPLGAAAGFGSSWNPDREYTAQLLGFAAVEENSLDCISSRGELEAQIAGHMSLLANQCATIAQDMILMTHPYFGFAELDDAFVTGSSIMPQKRNPDVLELTRATAAYCHGQLTALLVNAKGAMSGYNRDTQINKYVIMDIFREFGDLPLLLSKASSQLRLNRQTIQERCAQGFMNAADTADKLCKDCGFSFRDAYNLVALSLKYSATEGSITAEALQQALAEEGHRITIPAGFFETISSPDRLVAERTHTGAPSQAAIEAMLTSQVQQTQRLRQSLASTQEQTQNAFAQLLHPQH